MNEQKISLKNTIRGLELLNEILGCCELKADCNRSLVLKNTSELLNLLIYCDQVVSAKFEAGYSLNARVKEGVTKEEILNVLNPV